MFLSNDNRRMSVRHGLKSKESVFKKHLYEIYCFVGIKKQKETLIQQREEPIKRKSKSKNVLMKQGLTFESINERYAEMAIKLLYRETFAESAIKILLLRHYLHNRKTSQRHCYYDDTILFRPLYIPSY